MGLNNPSNFLRALAIVVASLVLGSHRDLLKAENWSGYRGPTGQGLTTETNLPTEWGGPKNLHVRWKTPLPPTVVKAEADRNQSSPIIWNDRIYATTVYWPAGTKHDEFPEQHVSCYQLDDGKQLWDVTVPHGPWRLGDLRGGYGAPTPATDGQRLYVAFGSAIIAALDMQGKLIWKQELKDSTAFDVAFATSPVIYRDSILMHCGRNNKLSTLTAYDAATGNVRWEKKQPTLAFDHTTPTLVKIAGKPQLLVSGSSELQGVEPESGDVVWFASASGDVPSPVYDGSLVYSDSGRGGPGIAVDPIGMGDVTKTNIKWKIPQIPEGLGSAALSGDYLLRLHTPGVLRCFNFKTGKELFSSRLEGVSTQSSPIVAPDGVVYFASAGKSYVVKAGPKLEILATNDLQDGSEASPAVAPKRLILKGSKYMYCIRKD